MVNYEDAIARSGCYLSHLSLLFLQGSQLIALRARFVGGRPSPFCSPGLGDVLPRTVPVVVVDFACLCRGGTREGDAELSSGMVHRRRLGNRTREVVGSGC
jgi:hypothetical protein